MSGEYFELQIDDNIDDYGLQKLKKRNMKYQYLTNKCTSLNIRCCPTLAKFCNKNNKITVFNNQNEIKKIICDKGISLQLQMFDSKDQKAHKNQMYIDDQEQQLLEKYGIRCQFLDNHNSKMQNQSVLQNKLGQSMQLSSTDYKQLTLSQVQEKDQEITTQIQQQLIDWFNKKPENKQYKLLKRQRNLENVSNLTKDDDFLQVLELSKTEKIYHQLQQEQQSIGYRPQCQTIEKQKHEIMNSLNSKYGMILNGKNKKEKLQQTKDHIYDLNKTIKEKNTDQDDMFMDHVYNNQLNPNQKIYGFGGLSVEEVKYRFSMKHLDLIKRSIKAKYAVQTPFNTYRCIFLQLVNEILQYKNQQIQLLLIKGNQTAYYQKLDNVWPELIVNLNYQFGTQLPKSFPYFKNRYTVLPRVPHDDPFIKEKVYSDAASLQLSLTNAFQADIDNFIIELVSSGQIDVKKQYGYRILEYFQQIKPQLPNSLTNPQGFIHAHVSQRHSEQLSQDDVKRYLVCYSEVLFLMQNQQFLEYLNNESKQSFETKKEQLHYQFTEENVVNLSFYLAQYLEQLFYQPLQQILTDLKSTTLENKALQQTINERMKECQEDFMINKCQQLIQQILTSWDKIRLYACQSATQIIKQRKASTRNSLSCPPVDAKNFANSFSTTQGTNDFDDMMKMYASEEKEKNVIDLKSIVEGTSVAAVKANEEKYPYLINSHIGRVYEGQFLLFVCELLDAEGGVT